MSILQGVTNGNDELEVTRSRVVSILPGVTNGNDEVEETRSRVVSVLPGVTNENDEVEVTRSRVVSECSKIETDPVPENSALIESECPVEEMLAREVLVCSRVGAKGVGCIESKGSQVKVYLNGRGGDFRWLDGAER